MRTKIYILLFLLLMRSITATAGVFDDIADRAKEIKQERDQKAEEFMQSQRQKMTAEDLNYNHIQRLSWEVLRTVKLGCTVTLVFIPPETMLELAARFPDYRNIVNSGFAGKFPGSSFDCVSKTGTVVTGNIAFILRDGDLVQYQEQGEVLYRLVGSIENGFVGTVSSDTQSVSFVISKQGHYFNDARLTITASRSEGSKETHMQNSRGKEVINTISNNEFINALNRYYADLQGVSIFAFAKEVILNPEVKGQLLNYLQGGTR